MPCASFGAKLRSDLAALPGKPTSVAWWNARIDADVGSRGASKMTPCARDVRSCRSRSARQEEGERSSIGWRRIRRPKCYLPGVPADHVHAVPVSDRPDAHPSFALLYEYVHATRSVFVGSDHPSRPHRLVDGRFARALGGRHARSWTSCTSATPRGSIAPGTFTATRCTWWSAIRTPPHQFPFRESRGRAADPASEASCRAAHTGGSPARFYTSSHIEFFTSPVLEALRHRHVDA